jgi:hypothetical protein
MNRILDQGQIAALLVGLDAEGRSTLSCPDTRADGSGTWPRSASCEGVQGSGAVEDMYSDMRPDGDVVRGDGRPRNVDGPMPAR